MDPDLDKDLNLVNLGYRKEVAGLRAKGEMSAFEGKQPLSFSGYCMLAAVFLHLRPEATSGGNNRGSGGTATTWSMGTFGWAFMIMQWNLISRSANVGSIMIEHLSWSDDHLTVSCPQSKTDQCGESTFPKSIFANPHNPTICPILALAVTVFSRSFCSERITPKLFEGSDQEDRYSKLLRGILSQLPESLLSLLGAKPDDIGTHSGRKGPPTYVLSLPGGPSPVSVYLRAGWSLGNTKDRYIFQGRNR